MRKGVVLCDSLLRVDNVKKTFGGLMAIVDLYFEVRVGQIKSVIGPNGAGKTTLFNLITGVIPMSGGQIIFGEKGHYQKETPSYRRPGNFPDFPDRRAVREYDRPGKHNGRFPQPV